MLRPSCTRDWPPFGWTANPIYRGVDRFHDGLAVVYKSNPERNGQHPLLHGVINSHGDQVIPCVYDDAAVKGGITGVMKDSKIGYADSFGNWIWHPELGPRTDDPSADRTRVPTP